MLGIINKPFSIISYNVTQATKYLEASYLKLGDCIVHNAVKLVNSIVKIAEVR